ncbi:MAG: efflux RND transporter permease subunit [Nocardioidaceae bacterium]
MAAPRRTLMRRTVSASLRFRYLVVALGALTMAVGIITLPSNRVDAFPEFAPPRVVVQTACLGLSTSDVEQLVTVPLEQAFNGIDGLDVLRSKSVPQLSSVELIFKQNVDMLHARQLVQERMTAVANSLPTWAAPPVMLAPVSATGRAVQIGMTSKDHSLIEMSMTAYWTIRARLLEVPGVANVALWNERLQQMTVQVQPSAMQAKNVSLDQVMEATADAVDSGLLRFSSGSVIGTGGMVETPNQRLPVRNVLPIVTPADLAQVPVQSGAASQTPAADVAAPSADKAASGQGAGADQGQEAAPPAPVKLGDVATVQETHQPLIGDAIINDQPGLLLVVEKLPWANTVQMTRGVQDAIHSLEPGLPGVHFDTTIFQQANFIELAIHNLTQALVLGFILVVVILGLFLFEWRVALISLLTIPLSLTATILVLHWMGQTINSMILAGLVIALGAVVDDAIIDVENIVRRLRQHRRAGGSRASTGAVILEASLEVRSPIVFATLIIVAAAIPVFLLQGLTGAFFRPLALSYTLAIVASMVVALTLTPALTLILLRNTPIERRESPLVRVLQRGCTWLLARVIRRPRFTYAGVLVVIALGVAVVPTMGQSLFPHFKEPDFLIHWVTQPGTSATEMERTTTDVSNALRQIPGVRNFGAHVGQAFLGEEVAGVNLGENWVTIDPSVDYDKTLARIEDVTNQYPGLFRETQNYLDERIEEVVSGAKEPIVVRVFGPDLHVLRAKAEEINKLMATIPGAADHHVDISSDVPQIQVEVDLARAAQYGLKPGDVRRAAATMIAGEEVGDIFRGGRAYDTVVWSVPTARGSVQDIENMLLDTPTGQRVRIGDLASVSVQPNPNAIDRQGGSRKLDVETNAKGRDLGSVVTDLQQKLTKVDFPRGYHAEVIGEFQERQAAQSRLLATAGIALVLILLLLQLSLGSWRLTVLVFLSLPFALVGGLIAAWGTGRVLSIGSLVGFFTVFGIAARNGILLINHAQHLEREEGEPFGVDLVIRAAKERLSPILMTSLATGLALVPLVVLGSRPGHEIEYPLAVVILGGLLTSTLLNLFVTPVLYLRFGKPREEGTSSWADRFRRNRPAGAPA